MRRLETAFSGPDVSRILLNPAFQDYWPGTVAALRADPWHPLASLTFALDRTFFGISSFGFHLTNLCLHAAAVALVYRAAGGEEMGYDQRRLWAAFLAAVSFGVNPIAGGTVAVAYARPEILSAMGLLAAAIFGEKSTTSAGRLPLVLAAASAAFAVAANPFVAGLPFLCYLYLPSAAAAVAAARLFTRSEPAH